jgi:hypothetical protein
MHQNYFFESTCKKSSISFFGESSLHYLFFAKTSSGTNQASCLCSLRRTFFATQLSRTCQTRWFARSRPSFFSTLRHHLTSHVGGRGPGTRRLLLPGKLAISFICTKKSYLLFCSHFLSSKSHNLERKPTVVVKS